MIEHLKFSPDILRRLGEELVPDVDQGIIELVKNSYDADATDVTVEITNSGVSNVSVIVRDNGRGMCSDEIRDGWLVIGQSSKNKRELTAEFNRIPAGDKGLGRLAALRMGESFKLVSRPKSMPGKQFELILDWKSFSKVKVVEEVDIEVRESETSHPHGTEIHIHNVGSKISRGVVTKLARALLLLSDPFKKFDSVDQENNEIIVDKSVDPGFTAKLLSSEYADLEAKVKRSYFDEAEYRIHVVHRPDKTIDFSILDWQGNSIHQHQSEKRYSGPSFVFDLWVFLLDAKAFSIRKSNKSEVQEWLKHLGGVHIYEDGIRVPPYGGVGDDWLELNLRRSRSPEQRPSTNTAVGRVKFSNRDRELIQKTDRVGYLENTAFSELKECCIDALNWAANTLVKERDRKNTIKRKREKQESAAAKTRLDEVLGKSVKPTERKKVEKAVEAYMKESGKEADTLKEALQLYRSLATAGMTSAVFAHEIGRPLTLIDRALAQIKRLVSNNDIDRIDTSISGFKQAKIRLDAFISVPLSLLAKNKRRSGPIDVNNTITELLKTIKPIAEYFKTEFQIDLTDSYTSIIGSKSLLEGIILNLVMNSLSAFTRPKHETDKRVIKIETSNDGFNILIAIEDNAGGIDGVDIDDIWLPGVTTTPDGTGFGLTIVRDSVDDLNGEVEVIEKTDLGGARFEVKLPIMRELI